MWLFLHLLSDSKIRQVIKIAFVPVLLFEIAEYALTNTPVKVTFYTFILGNLTIVFLSLVYFREIIRGAPSVNLKNNPALLIVTGTFLYHSATTPFFLYINLLNEKNQALSYTYFTIHHAFNIIMYSLFLTSFLCKAPFRK